MAKEQKAKSLREEFPNAIPLSGGTGEMFKWDTPGARLQGRFLKLRSGSMGGQLVDIDTGDEIVTASAPQTLADALDGVRAGTRVVIQYTGEQQPKKIGGRPYKAFEVVALPEDSRR